MTPARSFLRRTAALWAGSLLAIAILLQQGVRLFAPDTWLALGAGQFIQEHGIPRGEPWVRWGTEPWIDQQWLGQWIIALVHGVAGNALTLLLLAILPTIAALAIAGWTAWRLEARPWAIGIMLPLAALALTPFVMIRPQTLVFPLFALGVDVIIRGRERPERLWLLLPILILWANIHGTVIVAAVVTLAGIYWARRGQGGRATWRGDVALYVSVALSPLVSPLVADLPAYYDRMLATDGAAALALEWQPLNAALDPALALLVIGAGITLARSTARTLPLALAAAGAALATLMIVRFGPWLALIMCALAPVLLSTVRGRWLWRHARRVWRRAADGTIALILGALALGMLGAVISDLPGRALAPSAAGAQAVPPGPVLADLTTANWLLHTRPELAGHPLIDARLERYTRPQLERAVQATQGLRRVSREDAAGIVLGGPRAIRDERARRMQDYATPLYADRDITVLAVRP